MTLIWALLGGLAYRIRGGLLDDILGREIPNGYIRGLWASFVGVFCMVHGSDIIEALLIAVFAFVGVLPGYFGGQFDLSRKENINWKNYARLTARGMFIMLPPAVIASLMLNHTLWIGVIAGALFVPCYLAGNIIYKYSKLQSWTQWGEWLLGAAITAAIAI